MNPIAKEILDHLSKGRAELPDLWLDCSTGRRELICELDRLVDSGHVRRIDNESEFWYLYEITDKGARWINRTGDKE